MTGLRNDKGLRKGGRIISIHWAGFEPDGYKIKTNKNASEGGSLGFHRIERTHLRSRWDGEDAFMGRVNILDGQKGAGVGLVNDL
jgi:diadenosine tetraphosphate (Ap4A) HIT family hydrolase